MAIDDGAFAQRGISLEWTDIPEGTGRMCKMLQQHDTDLAIILTEGIIKSITEGNPAKIVQQYIGSPLLWGIHVAGQADYNSIASLQGTKAAISRFGSGSHLMAYVHAQNEQWDTTGLRFEITNNLDGAIAALTEDRAQYFMWERFTTKPFVDQGIFRHLGDCPTPWPCFVIAANRNFLADEPAIIKHILEVINLYTQEFKAIPSIDRTLANRYNISLEDVQQWLSLTRWSQSQIDPNIVNNVQVTLSNLKLIDSILPADEILNF